MAKREKTLFSGLDFDERLIARQLDGPAECGSCLGQHRFRKTGGGEMHQNQPTHPSRRRDSACVPSG